VVAVLVLYPLSFGPVCWLADRKWLPDTLPATIYRPLAVALANSCSDRTYDAVINYGTWGSGPNPGFPAALILLGTERMKVWNRRH
jgi:hypothetical protein